MNWDNLQHFIVLAREGTISRASKQLGVHHTTVARRIIALEETLKTQLFDREFSGYTLTQSGEEILALVQKMEHLTHAIERKVYGKDASLAGSVRLTMQSDLANALIIPELHAFLRQYPEIDLDLIMTAKILDLNTREADIALRLTREPPEHLIGRRIAPLRMGIYASPSYLETATPPYDILLYRFDEAEPSWMAQHFPDAQVILRWDNLGTAHKAVMAGLGIAALPCFIADATPGLTRLRLEMTQPDRHLWLLTHEHLKTSARVRVCKAFLEEVLDTKRDLILGALSNYGALPGI